MFALDKFESNTSMWTHFKQITKRWFFSKLKCHFDLVGIFFFPQNKTAEKST